MAARRQLVALLALGLVASAASQACAAGPVIEKSVPNADGGRFGVVKVSSNIDPDFVSIFWVPSSDTTVRFKAQIFADPVDAANAFSWSDPDTFSVLGEISINLDGPGPSDPFYACNGTSPTTAVLPTTASTTMELTTGFVKPPTTTQNPFTTFQQLSTQAITTQSPGSSSTGAATDDGEDKFNSGVKAAPRIIFQMILCALALMSFRSLRLAAFIAFLALLPAFVMAQIGAGCPSCVRIEITVEYVPKIRQFCEDLDGDPNVDSSLCNSAPTTSTTGAVTTKFVTTRSPANPTTASGTPVVVTSHTNHDVCFQTGVDFKAYGSGFDGAEFYLVQYDGTTYRYDRVYALIGNDSYVLLNLYSGWVGNHSLLITKGSYPNQTLSGVYNTRKQIFVFFADPPAVYNGLALTVTLWSVGIQGVVRSVTLNNGVIGAGYKSLYYQGGVNVTQTAANWNRVQITIPIGTPAGKYSVEIYDAAGCYAAKPNVINVIGATGLSVNRVDPPFIWGAINNGIGIYGAGFVTLPRVYINPNPAVAGRTAQSLSAVVVVDPTRIQAVVREPAQNGTYDVIVINPDNTVGFLARGLTISNNEPPIIETVIPAYLESNTNDAVQTIVGRNFNAAGATISLDCQDWTRGTISYFTTTIVNRAGSTSTSLSVQMPGGSIGDGRVCVVRVTNPDGQYYDWSAIDTRVPSSKLKDWLQFEQSPLIYGRRGAVGANVAITSTSKYMYVIGGDNNTRAGCMDTVESAALDKYGNVQPWYLQTWKLPSKRAFGSVQKVGRFLYYTGGWDCTLNAPSNKVFRAEVLDPLMTPELNVDLTIEESYEGLQPGIYYYRVAALFAANDPNNPGGWSLPGEVLTIVLPPELGTSFAARIKLMWDEIPDAIGYKIYRTPTPNLPVSECRLIATVMGAKNLSFVDPGLPAGSEIALPVGSTGVWHTMPDMPLARWGHSAVAFPSWTNHTTKWYLNIFDGATNAALALTTQEDSAFITITLDRPREKIREFQNATVMNWITLPTSLSPRNRTDGVFGGNTVRVGAEDMSGLVYPKGSAVIAGPGWISSATTTNTFYAGVVARADSPYFTGAFQTPNRGQNSFQAYGYCFFQAFGLLHVIAGYSASRSNTFPVNWDGSQALPSAGEIYFNNGLCPDPFNMFACTVSANGWSSQNAGGTMSLGFPACGKDNALFFLIGGSEPGTGAPSRKVWRTPQ